MSLFAPLKVNHDIDELFREMDHLFAPRQINKNHPEISEHYRVLPPVDLKETEDFLTLSAVLPGFTEEDINLEVDNNVLTITAEHTEETSHEEGSRTLVEEIFKGKYVRQLKLPVDVMADKTNAIFKNGILTVEMPKASVAKRHKIAVKASK